MVATNDQMTISVSRSDVAEIRATAQVLMDYADSLEALQGATAPPTYKCGECEFESESPQGISAHQRAHKPAAKKRKRKARRSSYDWSDAEKAWLRSNELKGLELVAAFRSEFPEFSGTDKAITAQSYNVRRKVAA